jgi:hypothetical protein
MEGKRNSAVHCKTLTGFKFRFFALYAKAMRDLMKDAGMKSVSLECVE